MIGVVLAGGHSSLPGMGDEEGVRLAGRPLASYPVEALSAVCERVAVVCKPDTGLPELEAERWEEPEEPRHPLTGIIHALETAGAPVLVCAANMPFVTADACRTLLEAVGSAPAVVAVASGVLEPELGLYAPAALEVLRAAPPDDPLTRTVEALDPGRVALPGPLVKRVRTLEDLAEAEEILRGP